MFNYTKTEGDLNSDQGGSGNSPGEIYNNVNKSMIKAGYKDILANMAKLRVRLKSWKQTLMQAPASKAKFAAMNDLDTNLPNPDAPLEAVNYYAECLSRPFGTFPRGTGAKIERQVNNIQNQVAGFLKNRGYKSLDDYFKAMRQYLG